jgi:hypothetical protein
MGLDSLRAAKEFSSNAVAKRATLGPVLSTGPCWCDRAILGGRLIHGESSIRIEMSRREPDHGVQDADGQTHNGIVSFESARRCHRADRSRSAAACRGRHCCAVSWKSVPMPSGLPNGLRLEQLADLYSYLKIVDAEKSVDAFSLGWLSVVFLKTNDRKIWINGNAIGVQ